MSSAHEVVLGAVRFALGTGDRAALHALGQAAPDWERARALAGWHGLLPLYIRGLQDAGLAEVALPDGGQATLRGNAQRNLRLTAELIGLLDALEAAGVEALAYKGPVLAAWAFGDLSLRNFMDLDLLVRERDVAAVHEVVYARGYAPVVKGNPSARSAEGGAPTGAERWRDMHRVYWSGDRRVLLEVHWGITPGYFGARLDTEALFAQAMLLPLGGREVRTLSPAHCLLAACIHGALHRWERLSQVCSVAEVVRAITREGHAEVWQDAWELAGKVRARRMLLLGLAVARDVLGVDPPPEMVQRMAADRALPRLVRGATWRLAESELRATTVLADTGYRLHCFLASRDRFSDGLGSLLRWLGLLLAPGEADRQWLRLPRALRFLYVPLRPLRVLLHGHARPR